MRKDHYRQNKKNKLMVHSLHNYLVFTLSLQLNKNNEELTFCEKLALGEQTMRGLRIWLCDCGALFLHAMSSLCTIIFLVKTKAVSVGFLKPFKRIKEYLKKITHS